MAAPEIDEDYGDYDSPAGLALELAGQKAKAVAARLSVEEPTIVIGCDSVLEMDGRAYGKPGSEAIAVARWRRMRGSAGTLHTGHHVIVISGETDRGELSASAVGSTLVRFAVPSDAEIDAYVATGEPLHVAGAFAIDGLGGAFITGVEGDPHNVVGISLPLLRSLLGGLGINWVDLWQ